ncbi:hypothetical protein Sjap_001526 [Stephania japonica]|uniref:Transmembrane protein n=1 Tax=Stephania japonica TaxID=461633 RepID=A0AAP0PV47_9MAGN
MSSIIVVLCFPFYINIDIVPTAEDECKWEWEVSKTFSVKSAFYGLCLESSVGNICRVYSLIWKSCASMKVRVFTWMTWLGKINTTDCFNGDAPIISYFHQGVLFVMLIVNLLIIFCWFARLLVGYGRKCLGNWVLCATLIREHKESNAWSWYQRNDH